MTWKFDNVIVLAWKYCYVDLIIQMLQTWTVAVMMMIDTYVHSAIGNEDLKAPSIFVSSHHCVVIMNVCFCLFWWWTSHLHWCFDLKAFEFQQKSRMCRCVPELVVSDVLSSRVRLSKKNSYSSWTPSLLNTKALDSFKMSATTDPAI